jgi:thymidylate synthase
MKSYLDTLEHILKDGDDRGDRTGVGTRGVFGVQTRYNLQDGFPAMTTKKLAWKAVVSELLWFLEGSGDERRLCEIRHGSVDADKKTIWTANAEAGYWKHKAKYPGDLGRVYGVQWRHWQTFHSLGVSEGSDELVIGRLDETDQIANLIDGIKNDPFGRRHLLTAWNPGELDQMALPPCHLLAQFNVTSDGKLDCQMYQRSNDFFLGGPFNIASYSLLTHIIAQVCNLKVGEFIHVNGDAHLYKNHFNQAQEQLSREPYPLPELWLNPDIKCIDDFTMDDIKLKNYKCHPVIKAPMAV